MADPADGNAGKPAGLSPKDRAQFKKRLSELDRNIDEVRDATTDRTTESQRGSALGYAFRLATELVVGVCFGGFVGWWIDKWLATSPIFLLVFVMLGLVAGLVNVIRTAKQMQATMTSGAVGTSAAETPENGDRRGNGQD